MALKPAPALEALSKKGRKSGGTVEPRGEGRRSVTGYGAPGYALRTDHGNPESTDYLINPFAQLDAHNSREGV